MVTNVIVSFRWRKLFGEIGTGVKFVVFGRPLRKDGSKMQTTWTCDQHYQSGQAKFLAQVQNDLHMTAGTGNL